MATRISVGALAAVLGFSVSVSAQTGAAADSREPGPFAGVTAASARESISPVETLLQRRVDTVDWDEVPLEEVLDWLDDQCAGKVNIVPRWNALELEDVNPDKTVKLTLRGATIGVILTEVLDQLSETGEVTFRGSGNTLRISTRQDFNRRLEFRVYNVTDVLFRVPDFSESAPQIDLQQQTGGAQGQQGGQPVFRSSGGQGQEELSEEGQQDPEKILEDLVEMIQNTIAPDTWEEAGGLGRIRGFNRRFLIIYNTVDVHEMIAGYYSLGR